MNEIFLIEELADLEVFLSKQNTDEIRENLFAEFLRYSDYKNATEWNKAVRLCECLAIVGWGEHEPLQAVRGKFFNGNPETGFYNKFVEPRFVDAIWSKRKDGLTMEDGRTTYHFSPDFPDKKTGSHTVTECIQDLKLSGQRNWIPRTPVYITRTISNCYENSKAVLESIDKDLQVTLNSKMTPEKYGRAIDFIRLDLCVSYPIRFSGETNYIIADEKLKLKYKDFYKVLCTMYTKKEINANGLYLRNRYEYGGFRNGVFKVEIHFEKELGEMEHHAQKQKIAFHLEEALNVVIEKLKKKKLVYDFDLMRSDFLNIVNEWC
jgi:hypothetical protein